MIIANAQVSMTASHQYYEESLVSEKLDFWLAEKSDITITENRTKPSHLNEQVTISSRGFSLSELLSRGQSLNFNTHMDSRSRMNLMVLKQLYESITGQKMTMIDPSQPQGDLSPTNSDTPQTLSVDAVPPTIENKIVPAPSAGYGMTYQRQERYLEQEKMQFSTEGVVRTQDGREITFSTSLTMSRSYYEESNVIIRAGDAKKIDPLVINFNGKGAELSQTTFKFDLDSDGSEEQLASLRPGSGFLALDRNGDGTINNGSELFGPSSGLGFAELAKFDEDGNQFIDEGDSIYNKLRIWSFNEDGSTQLVALGDKNIGAIFLGHVTTPFQLKDEQNKSLGEVANSGIYLQENGQTGLVQEVNLTV